MIATKKQQEVFDILFGVAIAVEPVSRAKVAACIVRKGKIVSFGVNKMKSHPFQLKYSNHPEAIYLHAETAAIKRALSFIRPPALSDCSLFVLRVKRPELQNRGPDILSEWQYAMAKPCQACEKAIVEFQIKEVLFTTGRTTHQVYGRMILS